MLLEIWELARVTQSLSVFAHFLIKMWIFPAPSSEREKWRWTVSPKEWVLRLPIEKGVAGRGTGEKTKISWVLVVSMIIIPRVPIKKGLPSAKQYL